METVDGQGGQLAFELLALSAPREGLVEDQRQRVRATTRDCDGRAPEEKERSLLAAGRFQANARVWIEEHVVAALASGRQVGLAIACPREGLLTKKPAAEQVRERFGLLGRHRPRQE